MLDSELLRYSTRKYVVFDTETEGLSLWSARAWNIAWIVCEGDAVLEKHQHFLKWENLRVSKGAAKVTGFTPELIDEKGESPAAVLKKLDSFLLNPEFYLVAHNCLNFDVYVLNSCKRSLGLPNDFSYLNRLYDSNAIARAVEMKIPFSHENDLLEYQYKLANSHRAGIKTNLTFLAKKYKIDFEESQMHGALTDVVVNQKVWRALLWKIEI